MSFYRTNDMQVDQWGKVRVRPHTVGSWACHVYLTTVVSPKDWREVTETGLDRLRALLPKVQLEEALHISLSKTFYAKHWQLEPLIDRLKDRLAECSLGRVTLFQWKTYENEGETRSFLALDCQKEPWLYSLVKAVDGVLAGYGFAPFYQDPHFHASIYWAPGRSISQEFLKEHEQLIGGITALPLWGWAEEGETPLEPGGNTIITMYV